MAHFPYKVLNGPLVIAQRIGNPGFKEEIHCESFKKLEGANHGGSAALSFSHLDLSPLHSLSLILLDPVISLFDLSFLC
ncbi:hypothetical protein CMV_024530 [Castanea mollissima]|uniref:Uncharacterized protein n=1 Tax=Castanea mollissima TaxID=60419 RepID=A0A8J4QEN8_9ROSI|nr:hypothetical protein CMV_024530 [Castanea mollissima]